MRITNLSDIQNFSINWWTVANLLCSIVSDHNSKLFKVEEPPDKRTTALNKEIQQAQILNTRIKTFHTIFFEMQPPLHVVWDKWLLTISNMGENVSTKVLVWFRSLSFEDI